MTVAQRRLFEAREATEDLSRRAGEAGAAHAALVERAAALAAEVQRLEEAAAELEHRAAQRWRRSSMRRDGASATLRAAIVAGEAQLDADVRALDGAAAATCSRPTKRCPRSARRPTSTKGHQGRARALEAIRAIVSELDVARATAESDLSHLADVVSSDAVQATLDEVARRSRASSSATGDRDA